MKKQLLIILICCIFSSFFSNAMEQEEYAYEPSKSAEEEQPLPEKKEIYTRFSDLPGRTPRTQKEIEYVNKEVQYGNIPQNPYATIIPPKKKPEELYGNFPFEQPEEEASEYISPHMPETEARRPRSSAFGNISEIYGKLRELTTQEKKSLEEKLQYTIKNATSDPVEFYVYTRNTPTIIDTIILPGTTIKLDKEIKGDVLIKIYPLALTEEIQQLANVSKKVKEEKEKAFLLTPEQKERESALYNLFKQKVRTLKTELEKKVKEKPKKQAELERKHQEKVLKEKNRLKQKFEKEELPDFDITERALGTVQFGKIYEIVKENGHLRFYENKYENK